MSGIKGPKHREDRAMRAALLVELTTKAREFMAHFGATDKRTLQIITARNFLGHVARSPQRTGAEKNRVFRQVARELAGRTDNGAVNRG